ncbi:DUF2242 domain-containing protein [Pseudomonas syringae]|uniref:DUF2242 domain-containing protein n=1 Tax=Pseudomonas syringae pv. papulans TaxID=83963 RepID=A0A0Q0AF29_PSESX|nr:DUF2242 domain-containing protein [Pseudomonas syringae]KPY31695.1 putative lipoprotein [Pseudomonas syringae pv. papulans]KWS33463.1 hypothetical protein AL059_11410 [Pseudomonas syringae pv. papulans]MDH4601947.1 DUF2242 domain-containing protein [Pseudomonas syringae pv. papulans]MDH4624036.1 DUF2242 domain-containing protein [Pseudomonas syringae pv. papulans]RMN41536.1 putative lipoprotein [Pseudomonas syringae pv. papulans]
MFKLLNVRTALWISAVLMAAGCSSPKQAVYDHEHFDDAGTFSRSYPATDMAYCEAGRRALLSQGYIITSSDPKMIAGRKSFQQTGDTHIEISFNLVCAADAKDGSSTMFANALQDRYALKKTNNSASLGVGVLGSVSMPIGSTDDSMVKVASETVSSAKFYERFFGLVENFLPPEVKKAAHIVEKPKADLGVPDTAPAAPTAPAKAAEPAKLAPASSENAPKAEPAAEPVTPAASEPVPAPSEPASFKAETVETPAAEPAESTVPTPVEPAPAQ